MRIAATLACLSVLLAGADTDWNSPVRWSAVSAPAGDGTPRSFGSYTAGCVSGAEALEAEGPGFEVLRRHRGRYFGHPELIRFVRRFAASVAAAGLPGLLVGDLGQARGGPTPTDHASHQNGLDIDIAFARPHAALLAPEERERHELIPVVDLAAGTLSPTWNADMIEMLRIAGSDPIVERIFVNPIVKRAACESVSEAPWLRKLRPWRKHHDHFHVRLRCPTGSPDCRSQAPVPSGSGCGKELSWWLEPKASPSGPKSPVRSADLPNACRAVLVR